jgi:polyhydroxyalkanoate synthase
VWSEDQGSALGAPFALHVTTEQPLAFETPVFGGSGKTCIPAKPITMDTAIDPLNLLHQIDRWRRWQGCVLDAAGMGPLTTPSRVVLAEPGLTLRAYGERQSDQPCLLIVPAPIKRSYIWDLAPWASAVGQCLRGRIQVYLIDWARPGPELQDFGLAEYADRLIGDCLRAIGHEIGVARAFLAGHSLGGTQAAIFAALHPELVQGLVLLGASLHFGKEIGDLDRLAAISPPAQVITASLGNMPGSGLSLASWLASPRAFEADRWQDWAASLSDPWAMQTHVRVERWTLDETPLARRFFEETLELLYRQDRFQRGALKVSGRRVGPALVSAPLLSVVDGECRVVPSESVLPFCEAAASRDKQVLWYHGDTGVALRHVGMLVGRSAHAQLWPEIVRWLHLHSAAR